MSATNSNIENASLGSEILKSAVRSGKLYLVKTCIVFGADVNSFGQNSYTPLQVAAFYGHYNIIECLLRNGARVDAISSGSTVSQLTPLEIACKKNFTKCVRVLVDYGASVSGHRSNFAQPIHVAVYNNNVKIIKLLYEAGADVNVNFPQMNPYHSIIEYAIIHGQREVVNFILFETNFNHQNLDSWIVEMSEFQLSLINIHTQDDIEFVKNISNEFLKIKYTLVVYIVSRHMINLPIRIEVLSAALSVSFPGDESKNHLTIVSIINDIENVIIKLKKTLINNTTISYWRLLMCEMPELIILSGNEDIQTLCERDYNNQFYYIYYQIMRARLDSAISQNILFEETIDVISSLFNYSAYHLPYDCYRRILNFFTTEELQEFKNLQP